MANVSSYVGMYVNNSSNTTTEIPFGTKKTGIDAGKLGEQYIDDDYLYVCTTGGPAGVAVWKSKALVKT